MIIFFPLDTSFLCDSNALLLLIPLCIFAPRRISWCYLQWLGLGWASLIIKLTIDGSGRMAPPPLLNCKYVIRLLIPCSSLSPKELKKIQVMTGDRIWTLLFLLALFHIILSAVLKIIKSLICFIICISKPLTLDALIDYYWDNEYNIGKNLIIY